jgi:hypothetical protein
MARVQSILDIAREARSAMRADEVEALLVEEMRTLGNSTMREWAGGAQERLTQDLRQKDAAPRSRKKTLKWWTVFGLVEVRERIWRDAQPFRLLPPQGAAQVIAEADGTMICTVAPGTRKGERPRDWKEMRLVAAQAKDSVTARYAATFGSVEEMGRR